MDTTLTRIATLLLALLIVGVVLGALLIALVYRRIRRLPIPPEADFFTTLRAVPLSLVIGLDLLDAGLDIFAAPITWTLLSRLRLQALRNVAALEALVPLTQPVPVLTLAWLLARLFDLGQPPQRITPYAPSLDTDEVAPGEYRARVERR